MLGERASARRPGEDAREVERAHAGQRPVAARQRPRRGVADADHLDGGQRFERAALRVRAPLVRRPHHGAAHAARGERVLQRLRVPTAARRGDLRRIEAAAEHVERAVTQVREAAVQVDPAAVAAFVQRDGRIAFVRARRRIAIEPLEQEAEQRRRRGSDVDRHALACAASQHRQFRCGCATRGERRCRGLAGAELRRDDGVGAGDLRAARRAGARGRQRQGYRRVACGQSTARRREWRPRATSTGRA